MSANELAGIKAMNAITVIDNVEVLIAKINSAHAEAQAYAGKAVERALEAGDLLILAKARTEHGLWQSWLKKNCPAISVRTAQDYMRVARELPIEKRSAAHLTVREALRLVSGETVVKSEPEQIKSIDFLPNLGEMALFVDDDWEYMITHSSKHPNYYHLARWFIDRDDDDDCIYSDDPEIEKQLQKRYSSKKIPCDIFRRPMNERGLEIFLGKWRVLNEKWELFGYPDVNANVLELMSDNAEEEYRKKTWPKYESNRLAA